jgi:hypothetical protein
VPGDNSIARLGRPSYKGALSMANERNAEGRPKRGAGRFALAIAAGVLAITFASPARADLKPKDEWEAPLSTRRGGFLVGVELGFGVASVAGFPNDPEKIGFQKYYTVTGVRPASWLSAWVGGAFNDWLSFAVGFGASPMFATFESERVSAFALDFHVEGFPLFPFTKGHLRDVGIFLDAGTGPVSVKPKSSDTALVEGGAASLVGFGIFYEGIRGAHFGNGPFLATNYFFADSVRRPAVFLGWRTALYAGTFSR